MKKQFFFSILCGCIFLSGAASVLSHGSDAISESAIFYFLDFGLQLFIGVIFFIASYLLHKRKNSAIFIFRIACVGSLLYTAFRCGESIIDAKHAGLDNIPAIPIIIITGIAISSIFIYFLLISEGKRSV